MALIQSTAIPSTASDYEINQSLRFDESRSTYLSRTASATDAGRKNFSISFWIKPNSFTSGSSAFFRSADSQITLESGRKISLELPVSKTPRYPALIRDSSAWYHFLFVLDTTQGTEANRVKFYLNGELMVSENTSFPASDRNLLVSSGTQYIGSNFTPGGAIMKGYLAEYHFLDTITATPSDFGRTGNYGEWKPVEYSGSHGTNGFYLDFADSSDLGNDVSGNNNDWTVHNLVASDKMLDSPTNNFAVMNAVRPGCSDAFREGNLYLRNSASVMGVSTILPETGKWYWEVDPQDRYAGSPQYGIATEIINNETEVGGTLDGVKIIAYSGANDISLHGTGTLHGSTGPWTSDHIWGFALDNDNGKLWISRDGDWTHVLSGGNPSTATNPTASGLPTGYPIFGNIGSASTTFNAFIRVNFGADGTFFGNQTSGGYSDDNEIGDFKYDVPTGFLALCTKNLPDVAVTPSEHFNTVLYTGTDATNSTHAISGIGFSPSFVWTKDRDATYGHYLFDAVRGTGVTKGLRSNTTDDEGMANESYDALSSFDSDGFSITGGAFGSLYQDRNNANYVAWNWKAGNATLASNAFTQGSLASTCSRNVNSGFSIITYTGNATAGATFGHGLSKSPEVIIVKNRDTAGYGWGVGSSALGFTKALALNTTSAPATETVQWNDTAPSSTLITLGSDNGNNKSGDDYICYAFHSVDGFSQFGKYSGNGAADGTFVYTGFQPGWILIKSVSTATPWMLFDTKRDTHNSTINYLLPYTNAAEAAATAGTNSIDLYSNGFKLRGGHADMNANNVEHFYMCFAETPFKYSNAR